MDISKHIEELEQELLTLPVGSVTFKRIKGKEQPYLQWTENGKSKSKYIKIAEREQVFAAIERRKEIQAELKSLGWEGLQAKQEMAFETHVVTDDALTAMTTGVAGWEKRDCFTQLKSYLESAETDRVCLIFGLRRTGKTTMLRQAVADMMPEDAMRTAYIKARSTDTMAAMNRDLKKLFTLGYRNVFIDEVTLIPDFIDGAALFSDVYAAQGMKIVLSGTDSLGFWFALHQELYDRAITIHTTYIPYREHSRLLGIHGIDEYIRYGGTLRAGELDFDDEDVNAADASFRDDESTRRYIDTAICRNIQHSLSCCRDGEYLRHLQKLYDAGELTNAINRIIEDMNHRFVVRVLTKVFQSHDMGSAAQVMRKDRDPERRSDVLDRIDREAVTKRLMKLLDIRNQEEVSVDITEVHVAEIKEYLKALDLIVDCPQETALYSDEPMDYVLFTQPGMRYCQAQALIHALTKDQLFASLSEFEKQKVSDRILEEVRGRMMEDIVLLEVLKTKKRSQKVFKLIFSAGEFDMVIYDTKENTCECYEIKHSQQIVPQQTKSLLNETWLAQTEKRFGKITKRCVLYRGEGATLENGIEYQNVEAFLTDLS